MTILVRYITEEFTKFFFLFLFAFVFIILVGNFFSRIGHVFSSMEQFYIFIQEIFLTLPDLLELIFPITILLATITTFNLLNRTSEITAMRMAGMGFFRLASPILVFSLLIALFSYINQNYIYNWLAKQFPPALTHQSLPPIWKIKNDQIFYFGVRQVDAVIEKIAIFRWNTSPYRVSQHTTVESGIKNDNHWHLKNVNQRNFLPEKTQILQQSEWIASVQDFPVVSFQQPLDPQHLPLWSLYRLSAQLQEEGQDATRHWVAFHQKLAYPFTLVIMVLLGLALSLTHSRQGKAAEGMVLSCLFGILFWITNQIFLTIGNAGALPPILASWTVNLLALVLVSGLMRYYR